MKKYDYIGIDISKKTIDVAIFESANQKKSEFNHCKQDNSLTGYRSMLRWLRKCGVKAGEFEVCMEATGVYTYPLCQFLESKRISYKVVDPRQMKNSFGLVRGKNDQVDACRISYYAFLHRDEKQYSRLGAASMRQLRYLDAARNRLVKEIAKCKAVLTEARTSLDFPKMIVQLTVKQLSFLEKQLECIENEMDSIIHEDEEMNKNYNLLLSVPCVGAVNARNMIIYTCNFTLFSDARKYCSYIGAAPFPNSSGTSLNGKDRVLGGNKKLKADLSQAIKSGFAHNPVIKAYISRLMDRGKSYGCAANAAKCKVIRWMFATIKRGTPFVQLKYYENTPGVA